MKIHPQELLLEEWVDSLKAEYRKIVLHLIDCADCQAKIRALLRPRRHGVVAQRLSRILRWTPRPAEPAPVFVRCERFAERRWFALDRERAEAVGLAHELAAHPLERQRVLLENSERFQTWGLFELLVTRGVEESGRNPGQGEELARLALHLAPRLDAPHYGAELIADLMARAWGAVGNARRIKVDFRGAEAAFERALLYLQQGTGDVVERAILLDFRASLLRAERRFDEAARLLRRAISIFRDLADYHRAGRSLINLSTVHEHRGAPEEAISVLYEALELIDPAEEPQLVLCAWHNLMTNLAEAGRCMEAQGLFVRARPLYRRFPDLWTRSRESWVRGKIARGLGQADEAEGCFLSAREGFLAADTPYDAALVSLELASLYAGQGRLAELKQVAEEMVPIFASRQIHREALAALAFLRQAAAAERASLEVVRQVAGYLKRAQSDPGLRFEAAIPSSPSSRTAT